MTTLQGRPTLPPPDPTDSPLRRSYYEILVGLDNRYKDIATQQLPYLDTAFASALQLYQTAPPPVVTPGQPPYNYPTPLTFPQPTKVPVPKKKSMKHPSRLAKGIRAAVKPLRF
jgi:hypothetical protein